VAGCAGWAASHLLRVRWKRWILPQVVEWFGALFFCAMSSRCSSCSKPVQLVLEAGAAGAAAGEAGGVDHAVVGERGRRVSVLVGRFSGGRRHDGAGSSGVRRGVQRQPGVVVEPGDDLCVGAGGQPVVVKPDCQVSLGISAWKRR